MSWLSSAAKAVQQGEHDVARAIVDEAERTGKEGAALGRSLINRLPGHLGSKIFGGGRATMPRRPPHPGYGQGGYCECSTDPKTGMPSQQDGEVFTYSARLQLTGAQAIATDLGDFFTTAASDDLSSNNQFPFDFAVDEALLIAGITYSTAVAATGTELASFAALKLIERRFKSEEQYQLTVTDLKPLVYWNGTLGTPTATAPAALASVVQLDPHYVPWGRRYPVNGQWQLVLRTNRAFTVPANATLDLNLQLRGRRY